MIANQPLDDRPGTGTPDRDLDVVVLGATSVTGREVCRYLARREPPVRWAAAGRSTERIVAALARLGVAAPTTIVADVGDPGALASMAGRARVVLNLVGPYATSAEAVIDACVAAGADYVDLAGETPLMRRVQDRRDRPAREAGVKIVQACGYEALPPDLAIQLASDRAREHFDEPLSAVSVEVEIVRVPRVPRPSDLVSGGTLQSLVEVLRDPDAHAISDPALLIEDPGRAEVTRERSPMRLRPRRGTTGAAVAPLFPAPTINPPVIHRTGELLGDPVLRYREGLRLPGGRTAAFPAAVLAAGIGAGYSALNGLTRLSPERRARLGGRLERALPGAGYGPGSDRIDLFAWTLDLEARTAGGQRVQVRIDADGHPGYLTTATMMGETGALLSEPGGATGRIGCLTPAAALGTASAPRFGQAGLRFSTVVPA